MTQRALSKHSESTQKALRKNSEGTQRILKEHLESNQRERELSDFIILAKNKLQILAKK